MTGLAANTVPVISSSNTVVGIAPGTSGNVLTSNGTSWSSGVGVADGSITTAKLADSSVTGAKTLLPLFQCRLEYTSTTLLTLNRFGGSWLFINGLNYQIPSSAPTINVSGASASQLNYIYAYISGGAVTLEKSTTAYATDSTYGHLIKSGDATRTLVGLARTTGSTLWADSTTQRFVLSLYHQQHRHLVSGGIAGSTTSGSYAELSTNNRLEFLVWSNGLIRSNFFGSTAVNSAADVYIAIGLDGTTPITGAESQDTQAGANANIAHSVGGISAPAEGYHYVTLLGKRTAGTLTPGIGRLFAEIDG